MSDRKNDHIDLALENQVNKRYEGLYYEPLLSAHPDEKTDISIHFLARVFKAPLWISSMTGGTKKAATINKNLAKVAAKYGLGMGLGSCRPLLDGNERMSDFDLRSIIGNNAFYANLGIAQLEQLIAHNQLDKVKTLISDLQVDGLIIHVNPLQEWAQPEGDRFKIAPIETIKRVVYELETKIIVKEVGQGFGPNSLISLMNLPLAAIDFAAHGGTNFVAIELARHNALSSCKRESFESISSLGHDASEMIQWVNKNISNVKVQCKEFIISGGITDVLLGYKYASELEAKSIIGMGSAFLKYAQSYEQLDEFTSAQVELLKLAKCYLGGVDEHH